MASFGFVGENSDLMSGPGSQRGSDNTAVQLKDIRKSALFFDISLGFLNWIVHTN
jgi:hypothetical protein